MWCGLLPNSLFGVAWNYQIFFMSNIARPVICDIHSSCYCSWNSSNELVPLILYSSFFRNSLSLIRNDSPLWKDSTFMSFFLLFIFREKYPNHILKRENRALLDGDALCIRMVNDSVSKAGFCLKVERRFGPCLKAHFDY